MNIRKLAYSLAIIMLSYGVLSTLIASKLYGRFADLSPIHNFLGQKSPTYFCILIAIVIASLIFSFLVALSCIEGKRLSEGLFILCCDFFAVYHLLIFEAIAVPHNTLVLFGSYGIVLSSEMFLIQELASALIAGVIVVIVDWKMIKKAS